MSFKGPDSFHGSHLACASRGPIINELIRFRKDSHASVPNNIYKTI